jgi:hypothetical protein
LSGGIARIQPFPWIAASSTVDNDAAHDVAAILRAVKRREQALDDSEAGVRASPRQVV